MDTITKPIACDFCGRKVRRVRVTHYVLNKKVTEYIYKPHKTLSTFYGQKVQCFKSNQPA